MTTEAGRRLVEADWQDAVDHGGDPRSTFNFTRMADFAAAIEAESAAQAVTAALADLEAKVKRIPGERIDHGGYWSEDNRIIAKAAVLTLIRKASTNPEPAQHERWPLMRREMEDALAAQPEPSPYAASAALREALTRALAQHRAEVRREVERTGEPAEGGSGCWCHDAARLLAATPAPEPTTPQAPTADVPVTDAGKRLLDYIMSGFVDDDDPAALVVAVERAAGAWGKLRGMEAARLAQPEPCENPRPGDLTNPDSAADYAYGCPDCGRPWHEHRPTQPEPVPEGLDVAEALSRMTVYERADALMAAHRLIEKRREATR